MSFVSLAASHVNVRTYYYKVKCYFSTREGGGGFESFSGKPFFLYNPTYKVQAHILMIANNCRITNFNLV